MPRPPGSSAADANTRARLTGRPLSAASTRPEMRPAGGGGASLDCADVLRAGCVPPGCPGRGPDCCSPAVSPRLANRTERDRASARTITAIRQEECAAGCVSPSFHRQPHPAVLCRFPAFVRGGELVQDLVAFVRLDAAQDQRAAR